MGHLRSTEYGARARRAVPGGEGPDMRRQKEEGFWLTLVPYRLRGMESINQSIDPVHTVPRTYVPQVSAQSLPLSLRSPVDISAHTDSLCTFDECK